MGILTTISDTNWLTSGAATAGNSGFNTLSTAQFETDENGDKYITTAAANTALSARIDPTASVFASGETRYHCEIIVYAEMTGTSDTNAVGTPSGFAIDLNHASARGTVTFAAVNSTYAAGFSPSYGAFNGGATVGAAISGINKDCIPVDRKFGIGLFGDRAAGVMGVCINSVRIGGWTVSPVTAITDSFLFSLPATPGIRWRIYATATRPARSWTGTDHEFTADYLNNPSSPDDGLSASLPHISTDGLHGNFYSYTGTVTLSEVSVSGGNANRKLATGGAGGFTATSKFNLGSPPYNEYGDFAAATTVYVPSGGTYSLAIRNTDNTADLVKIQVSSSGVLQDGSGNALLASDGASVTLSNSHRYQLLLCFGDDGFCSWAVKTASDDGASRRAWNNQFALGWRAQPLGRVIVTASQNVQVDRFDIGPWIADALTDSLAVANEANVSPTMPHTANNLAYGFPHSDAGAIPGIEHHGRRWGQPRESFICPSGRSGRPRSYWISGVRDYLTHVRALRLYVLDGGCWNDIVQNGTSADTLISYATSDLAWCTSRRCQLILMPPFERPLGLSSSMTTAQQAVRRKYASMLPAFIRANANNDLLFYCDHTKAYRDVMRTTDGVHPANDVMLMTRAIQTSKQYARTYAGPSAGQIGYFDGRRNLEN